MLLKSEQILIVRTKNEITGVDLRGLIELYSLPLQFLDLSFRRLFTQSGELLGALNEY